MARMPKKTSIPPVHAKKSGVFQGDTKMSRAPAYPMNHTNGSPHTGLTKNRQKPGGGPGSSGPITDVDGGY